MTFATVNQALTRLFPGRPVPVFVQSPNCSYCQFFSTFGYHEPRGFTSTFLGTGISTSITRIQICAAFPASNSSTLFHSFSFLKYTIYTFSGRHYIPSGGIVFGTKSVLIFTSSPSVCASALFVPHLGPPFDFLFDAVTPDRSVCNKSKGVLNNWLRVAESFPDSKPWLGVSVTQKP